MSQQPYPTEITPAILASYAGLSDDEIERDIVDAERDLEDQRRKADAYLVTVATHSVAPHEKRLAQFRADNATYSVGQFKALLVFLRKLLAARREPVPA